jgi:hypothetical protein
MQTSILPGWTGSAISASEAADPRLEPRSMRSTVLGLCWIKPPSLLIDKKCIQHLTFMCVSLMYSLKYNQQDATLYNILYYCHCSTRFGRFLHPSSGTQELFTQHLVRASLAAASASGGSKPGTYQMLCIQFLSSWQWTKKPPETCRAVTIIKNIV